MPRPSTGSGSAWTGTASEVRDLGGRAVGGGHGVVEPLGDEVVVHALRDDAEQGQADDVAAAVAHVLSAPLHVRRSDATAKLLVEETNATVIGRDEKTDIALIKLKEDGDVLAYHARTGGRRY